MLENISHSFLKPNILDIKLGTVLYDESASEEKRLRMIKTAKQTTSFETGVRLTGFQVKYTPSLCCYSDIQLFFLQVYDGRGDSDTHKANKGERHRND